ncbi:MAG: hypothetical protein K8S14_01015 [Actinomycetia bacterium]|nr:hypothetical protein [Actinomycetes bacterium]
MINAVLKSYEENDTGAKYIFETDVNRLANYIQEFFKREGYQLQEGTPEDGDYVKGSSGLMRTILGGLVDRYKFNVCIYDEDGKTVLMLYKGMTGAMGGLWGFDRMRIETKRIREKINAESIHK